MKTFRLLAGIIMCVSVLAGCQSAKTPAAASDVAAPKKTETIKKSGPTLLEGFEAQSSWIAVGKNWGDGDCSKSVKISDAWATEGKSSLALEFNPLVKDKGATCFNEMLGITDFSAYEAILFDVKNPSDKPMQVSVAVTTGEGWEWFESNVFDLTAGENKDMRVDFFAGNMKSAGSAWQFTTDLKSPDNVLRLAFKFFGPEGYAGIVYVDNVRLTK